MLADQSTIQPDIPHIHWIDLIRVVAVFQVVLVHLSYVIFFKEPPRSSNWLAANFYDSFSRMGVPLFFMVSGYLLLGKSEPIAQFFRKRFFKVGIPTLFWSAAYLLWSEPAYTNGSMNPVGVTLSMFKAMYTGNVEIHLWFLYILIGIYLVVPVLRVYISAASRRDLSYFLGMWFLATSLIELVQRVIGIQTTLAIPVVGGYVGYFVLGYFLAEVELGSRGRVMAIIGCILAVAVTYFGTNALSGQAGPINDYFYSYFSPAVVLASVCGFMLLKELGQHLGSAGRFVRMVSATAFGVYLIHIFVIEMFRMGIFGFRLYSWMAPSVYMIPVTALVVFIFSFTIIFIMRKVPLIKMLVP